MEEVLEEFEEEMVTVAWWWRPAARKRREWSDFRGEGRRKREGEF